MDDETIKLILDMGGSAASVEDVRAKLEALKGTTRATADTYDVLSTVINKSVGAAGEYDVIIEKTNVELAREKKQLDDLAAAQAAYNASLDARRAKEDAALDAHVRKAVEATRAQQQLAQVLDETATHTAYAAAGVNELIGHGNKGTVGGAGIIGASYAVQDFTSVLTGGGGLGRALGAVSNNIPQLLIGLGAGAGLTGVLSLLFTGVAAGVPLIEKWWGAVDSEKAEDAKKKLQEVRSELEKIHAEFKKLQEKPTDYEAMAAEGIKGFLEGRGNAEKARAAVAAAATGKEAWESIAPDLQKEYRDLEKKATRTDADIEQHVREVQLNRPPGLYGDDPAAMLEDARRMEADAKAEREKAQRRREAILRGGRSAAGERIVAGATVAGPAGEAARKRLQQVAAGVPGLKELGYYTPERIKADEDAYEKSEEAGDVGSEAWAERQRAATRRRHELQRERDRGDELLRRKKAQLDEHARNEWEQFQRPAMERWERGERPAVPRDRHAPRGHFDLHAAARSGVGPIDRARGEQAQREVRAATGVEVAPRRAVEIQQHFAQAQATAMNAGLDATQATQQAMHQTISEFKELAQRARMLQRNAAAMVPRRLPQADPGVF